MAISEKKKFKTPNTYVLLFFILLCVAVLTWVIPGGQYALDEAGRAMSGTYQQTPANRQGLWDVIMAPIIGMIGNEQVMGAITISLNVMMFGSFLEMMDATGAINLALKNTAKKFQNNYYLLITVLTFLMGLFGTVQGAYEEGFVYLLMFLPIILSLGLDTIVALMIVIFGTQAGCAASIVNPFATGIASGIAGISPGEGIVFRTLAFVVLLSLCSAMICLYAKMVKQHPEKSVQFFRRQEDLAEFAHAESEQSMLTKPQKKVFWIFVITFVVMMVSLVPWESLNESWTIFKDIAEWINHNEILGTIIGSSVVPFGDWYFNEINGLLLVATVVSGFVMRYDIDKTVDILIRGAARLVPTALIVPLARGIQVLMTSGNITATVLNATEQTLGTLSPLVFVLVAFVVYVLLATVLPSSTGLAAATISIMAPLGVFAGISEANMVVIFNFALGFVKVWAPTSIVVMTCIQAVHVSYASWLKAVWKYAAVYFVTMAMLLAVSVFVMS